jgi:hypothetical protein
VGTSSKSHRVKSHVVVLSVCPTCFASPPSDPLI